jgi:hypothetical protein
LLFVPKIINSASISFLLVNSPPMCYDDLVLGATNTKGNIKLMTRRHEQVDLVYDNDEDNVLLGFIENNYSRISKEDLASILDAVYSDCGCAVVRCPEGKGHILVFVDDCDGQYEIRDGVIREMDDGSSWSILTIEEGEPVS